MAAMTAQQVLDQLGGQKIVRDYLRGVEADSETDRDAQRSMLAAIAYLRGAKVWAAMAKAEPELYAQACLMIARKWTDAEDAAAPAIDRQVSGLIFMLRHHKQNIREEGEGE